MSHTHTQRLSVYNLIQSVLNSHSLLPQTIFQIFPRLSELAEDEWLPLWKFESFVDFPTSALPLKNPVTDLCELQPGDWIQQDKGTHHMRAAEHWNPTTFMKTARNKKSIVVLLVSINISEMVLNKTVFFVLSALMFSLLREGRKQYNI